MGSTHTCDNGVVTTGTQIFTDDGNFGMGKTVYADQNRTTPFNGSWGAYGISLQANQPPTHELVINDVGIVIHYSRCPFSWSRQPAGYITDVKATASAACGIAATTPVYTDDGQITLNSILYTSASGQDEAMIVAAGYYGVRLLSENGVTTKTITIAYGNVTSNVTNCSGSTRNPIQSAQELLTNTIKIYPNPARKLLNIDIGNTSTQLTKAEIFDAKGASVMKSNLNAGKNQVNTSRLNAGIYILKLYNQEGKLIKVEKLVIQQ